MPRLRLTRDPSPNARLLALGMAVVSIVVVSATLARCDRRALPDTLPAITNPLPTTGPSPTSAPATSAPATSAPATSAPVTQPVPDLSASVPSVERRASAPPVPPVDVAAPATAPVPVVAIQTVPVVRDLVIDVDGELRATDSSGVLTLGRDEFGATVTVIGTAAEPALTTVEFLQWSDGGTEPTRRLAEAGGPVLQLGVQVSTRVVVELDADAAADAAAADRVAFESIQVGTVELPVGTPTRVVAMRAVEVDGALISESVEYSTSSASGFAPATFRPRPESVWVVR